MTKTLTENRWFYTENGIKDASWNIVFKSEVLSPVPSYDEYNEVLQKLHLATEMWAKWYSECCEKEKKLEIATKALKEYANSDEWELVDRKNVYWSRKRFPYPWRIAGKALKEMEGVK
jgi:hypothetical protein